MATKTLQSIDDAQAEFIEGGDLAAVGEDILPATDETHSLGSAELRWANVRASAEVTAGDSITGPYALVSSGGFALFDPLVQRIALDADEFYMADEEDVRIFEFDPDNGLFLRGDEGNQTTRYSRDLIELQDDDGLGTVKFKVEIGGTLTILAPALPTADPATTGRLYTFADNSGAGLVANLLTEIAAGARIVLQSNPA